jgi:hypothetical protein
LQPPAKLWQGQLQRYKARRYLYIFISCKSLHDHNAVTYTGACRNKLCHSICRVRVPGLAQGVWAVQFEGQGQLLQPLATCLKQLRYRITPSAISLTNLVDHQCSVQTHPLYLFCNRQLLVALANCAMYCH